MFRLICHVLFRQNDLDLLSATAVTRDGTDTEQESAQVHFGEENSPAGLPGLLLATFDHESGSLPAELSLLLHKVLTVSVCNSVSTSSQRAHLHVVGMLRFMSYNAAELPTPV